MFIGSSQQFDDAQLADRLDDLLDDVDLGNGTPLTAAVATALAVDLRISGRHDGRHVHAALSDVEMLDLAADIAWAVRTPHAEFELPLGTPFKTTHAGNFKIGREEWTLDAGRPGLHPIESTRRDAHGPNYDLLCAHITKMTQKLACRRIGLPTPFHIVDTDSRHLLQFPPFEAAGGVVLQRWSNGTDASRFCGALPEQIRDFAKSIVLDMRCLWKRRREVAARVGEVRRMAERAAAEENSHLSKVTIDIQHQHADEKFCLYLEYQDTDEALRDGPVLDFVPSHHECGVHRYTAPIGSWRLRGTRHELRELGADGRIDDVAAAVLAAAPFGPAAVLADLSNSYETTFELPSAKTPTFATLFWRSGVIRAEVSAAGALDFYDDRMELIDAGLPETIVTALPGRKVSEFAQLPFQCDCVVETADPLNGGGTRLTLDIEKSLIELSTGRIWRRSPATA